MGIDSEVLEELDNIARFLFCAHDEDRIIKIAMEEYGLSQGQAEWIYDKNKPW